MTFMVSFDVSSPPAAPAQPVQNLSGLGDGSLQYQFPRLNAHGLASIPEGPKKDRETRAIDHFFVD